MKHTLSILNPYNYRAFARVAYYNPTTRKLIATDTFRLHITSIDLWASHLYLDHTGNEVTTVREYRTVKGEFSSRKTKTYIDYACPKFPDINHFMNRVNYQSSTVSFDIQKIKALLKHPLINKDSTNAILHHDGSITIELKDWLSERHPDIFTSLPDFTDIGINLSYLLDGIQYLDQSNITIEWKTSLSPLHFSDATNHALIMPLKI